MGEIILTFNWDGTVEKETKGFTGKSCISATKFIEDALGETGERRMKKEALGVQYKNEEKKKQGLSY